MEIETVDPKLKIASEEIKEVLNKHDIAGVVMICSGEKAEFINHVFQGDKIGPSWSCIYLEDGGVRIKAKGRRDHSERYKINLSAKMAFTMLDVLANQFGVFDHICKVFSSNFKIEHGDRKFNYE